MTDLANQKRIASKVLKIGLHRVWIDPEASEQVAVAITRADIRGLVEEGLIKARPIIGVSRGRARARDIKRRYGHQKGQGRRKGAKYARTPKKESWMKKIRALRSRLKELRADGTLDKSNYCRLYRKAKGGEFRSRAHLNSVLKANDLLKE